MLLVFAKITIKQFIKEYIRKVLIEDQFLL